MKKLLMISLLLLVFAMPVGAAEITEAPVPDTGTELLPAEQGSFGNDLWYVIRTALSQTLPNLREGMGVCLRVFAAVMLLSMAGSFGGLGKRAVQLCGIVVLSTLLMGSAHAMIQLGADTVGRISDYGKLLLPVMTAALAAQGGTTSSAALYAGTALFDTILSTLITSLLVPMVYVYIALSVANAATGEEQLKKLRDFIKWLTTWTLKWILYIFVGYMGITGVVSGSTDHMTLKATKITISGAVPVVGGILSDASEAVVVGMGVVKSAAGIYGILALLAVCIGPFLKIGVQSILLKLTAFFSGVIVGKEHQGLIECFSTAMGFLLAMTGTVCLMQMISVVCFMRGIQL